jgi:peptidoglycan/xylan/chitin deacetylase (PgdA/CDA1 family)
MEVPADVFQRHLDWLQANGEVVSLEDALVRVREPKSDRLYVLTFDDGYADMYQNAFPLLYERRLPFTLYLTTDPVESGTPLADGADPLTWDQVAEMLASGLMTPGSHTHHHLDLRDLGAEAIAEELDTANFLIRDRLGARVRHFAYPWGYWSETAEPLVKERFVTAVLGGGPPVTDATDPHRIHRVPVQRSDGMFFFRRKLKKGMHLEEAARRRVRGYRGVRDKPPAT